MKIFFSRNDRKDKVGGATEKGRTRREKGGRKGAHFSKSFACSAAGRFALEFASSRQPHIFKALHVDDEQIKWRKVKRTLTLLPTCSCLSFVCCVSFYFG